MLKRTPDGRVAVRQGGEKIFLDLQWNGHPQINYSLIQKLIFHNIIGYQIKNVHGA